MKKYTHPQLNYTVIQQKDGSTQGKYWSYLRPNLMLETSSTKTSQLNVGAFYKIYSINSESLVMAKQVHEVTSFWKNK